jgi:hypothetical protein
LVVEAHHRDAVLPIVCPTVTIVFPPDVRTSATASLQKRNDYSKNFASTL